jgi:hypothetical protein
VKAYNAYLVRLPQIKGLLDESPKDELVSVRAHRILQMVDQQMTGAAPVPPKGKNGEVAELDWVVDPETAELDWVVMSKMSTAVTRRLNALAAPILAIIDRQSLQESTVAGAVRTNSARYKGFPGVSFHSTRSPDDPWQPVFPGIDDPKKWGIRANIEWPDDLKLSMLSPKLGHHVDSRLDLAGSTLIHPRPQLVTSALMPSSEPATSPGPIHKQPAEALTWIGQLGGSCRVRCFCSKFELLLRSDSYYTCELRRRGADFRK